MSLDYVGSIPLGVLSPLCFSVAGSLTASLTADLVALAGLVVNMGITPPTLELSIVGLIELAVSLGVEITARGPGIGFDFQALALIDAILDLTLQLAIPFSLQAVLNAGAQLFAYGYSGTGAAFGGIVGSALASGWPDGTGPGDNVNAMIIATVTPSVWTDIQTFFDIIPPTLSPGLTYIAQTNLSLVSNILINSTEGTIASLTAQLEGAIALSARLVVQLPNFATSLVSVILLTAALTAALTIGLPGATFQIEAILKASAAIQAKIDLLLKLTTALSGGGAYVYKYAGPGNGLGPALTSELAGGWRDGASAAAPTNAFMMGFTSPSAFDTARQMYGGVFTAFGPRLQRTTCDFEMSA